MRNNKNRLESAKNESEEILKVGQTVFVSLGAGFVGLIVDITKTDNYGGGVKIKVKSPTRVNPFYVSIALVTKTRRKFKNAE